MSTATLLRSDAVVDVAPVIPRLLPPYEARLHPAAADVERESIAWLRSFGVGETGREAAILTAGRFAWLAARAYPDAPTARLRLVADFVTWAFLFDEHCESAPRRERAAVDRLCAAVIATCAGADARHPAPLVRAFADLRRRTAGILGPFASAGFVADLAEFVRAVQAQLDLSVGRRDFATELRTRELTIGLYPCLHFIDPAGAANRSRRRDRALVQRDRMTALALCWTNDLISLPKELRAGESHNLVLQLHARLGGTLQAAIDEALDHYDRTLMAFAALDARCRVAAPASIAYSDGLRAWIAALPAWSYASDRYA
jgi:5-epi-alpha-selinene synthase